MREFALTMKRAWHQDSLEGSLPEIFWDQPDWKSLWQMREHLIDRALGSAKKRGQSYRNFRVGASAFVTSKESDLLRSLGRPAQTIYTGANWKMGPDERNTCAEQEIVSQVRQQEHWFYPATILALVVAGNALQEPDRESGVITGLLHPCNHCRKLLRSIPYIAPETLIVSIKLDRSACETLLFDELLAIHANQEL